MLKKYSILVTLPILLVTSSYAIAQCEKTAKNACKKKDGVVECSVPSTYYQTDTGIDLKAGQKYEITARGRVCWEDDSRCAGPEGSTEQGAEAWGLWAKIGENGNVFKVGDTIRRNATGSGGKLFLVIPEYKDTSWDPSKCAHYKNNTGSYNVTVSTR